MSLPFQIHPTSFTVQELSTRVPWAFYPYLQRYFTRRSNGDSVSSVCRTDLVTTKKAFANLATVMPGSPQVTPVWFDFDGKYIRIVGTH